MRFIYFLMPWWLAVIVFSIAGCAPVSPAPPSASLENLPPILANTIARLMVDGPNAYINGGPAKTGAYIVDGDTVSTGPNTSAKLILNRGGYIQLDENTDPLFKEGLCQLIKLAHGQVLFSTEQCQNVEAPFSFAALFNSLVNTKVSEQEIQVTVLEGHVEVNTPTSARMGSYQQFIATSDGTTQILQLTPEQALATVAWTQRYFHPPPTPQADGGVSPVPAAIFGTAAIAIIIEALRRGDSHPAPPVASPPVTGSSPPQTLPKSGTGQGQAPPSAPLGWCCQYRTHNVIGPMQQPDCVTSSGVFYDKEETAKDMCAIK